MTAATMRQLYNSQIVYDQDLGPTSWVDAFGPDVFKQLHDFMGEPIASSEYGPISTITKVGTSTFGPVAGQGGHGLITTGASDGDGCNVQFGLGAFKLTGASYLNWSFRYQVSEELQSKFFMGLSVVETNILGTPSSDLIGFRKADASAAVEAVLGKSSTETTVASVLTQDVDTWHTLRFEFRGPNGRVYFFVDDEETTRASTFANVPNSAVLIPSVVFKTGEAVSHTMLLDFIRTIQIGRT